MLAPINYEARIHALRDAGARLGLDQLVISGASNLAYFAGVRILNMSRPIFAVIGDSSVTMIVPALEAEHAARSAAVDEVKVYFEQPDRRADFHDPYAILTDELNGHRFVGLDLASASALAFTKVANAGFDVVDLSTDIRHMRMIKDATEIERIRLSAELAGVGISASLAAIGGGVSQAVIEEIGSSAILERAAVLVPGADVTLRRFTTSGPDASLPHLITTTRVVQSGDVGIHNRHVAVEGYMAELERTFVVGAATQEIRTRFALAEVAQAAGIDAVRPGVPMCDVDAACRAPIADAGFEANFIHRSGHGLGLDVHESPFLRWDNPEPLVPGMVISIEPGIYFEGQWGFRHSDTVLVTETGHEVLTSAATGIDLLTVGG